MIVDSHLSHSKNAKSLRTLDRALQNIEKPDFGVFALEDEVSVNDDQFMRSVAPATYRPLSNAPRNLAAAAVAYNNHEPLICREESPSPSPATHLQLLPPTSRRSDELVGQQSVAAIIQSFQANTKAPTLATGRRNLKAEKVSPQEAARRAKRRERNRRAAARCREKRQQTIEEHESTIDELANQKTTMQRDIEVMREERQRLLQLLETHHCVNRGVTVIGKQTEATSSTSGKLTAASSACASVVKNTTSVAKAPMLRRPSALHLTSVLSSASGGAGDVAPNASGNNEAGMSPLDFEAFGAAIPCTSMADFLTTSMPTPASILPPSMADMDLMGMRTPTYTLQTPVMHSRYYGNHQPPQQQLSSSVAATAASFSNTNTGVMTIVKSEPDPTYM